jgi:hypothetical protein
MRSLDRVALVAAIDPSRFAALPVPVNVAVVLNYHERMGIYGRFFCRGVVSTAEGFNGRISGLNAASPICRSTVTRKITPPSLPRS